MLLRHRPDEAERLSDGFTLIELLVVLAILGLLAAIAVPQVLKYLSRAKKTSSKFRSKRSRQASICSSSISDAIRPTRKG